MTAHFWSISESGKRAKRDDDIEVVISVHGVSVGLPKLQPPPFTIPWWVLKVLTDAQKREEEST